MIALEVAAGVTLHLGVPEGAREEAEGALPGIDVSAVPGARVVLRRGFVREGGGRGGEGANGAGAGAGGLVVVRVGCVVAPSDRWAPGVEELVLGRATGLATGGLGAAVERWEASAITAREGRFEQRIVGRAGGREVAGVAHTLGFVGASHEVVLCSVGCAGGEVCREVLGATRVTGELVGPPPPSALVRGVLLAAERPYEAVAVVGAVGVAVVAVLLARRPKVPWRGSGER